MIVVTLFLALLTFLFWASVVMWALIGVCYVIALPFRALGWLFNFVTGNTARKPPWNASLNDAWCAADKEAKKKAGRIT